MIIMLSKKKMKLIKYFSLTFGFSELQTYLAYYINLIVNNKIRLIFWDYNTNVINVMAFTEAFIPVFHPRSLKGA